MITNGEVECLKGVKVNGLYVFSNTTLISPELNLTTSSVNDRTTLWHLRLGHVGELG